jgi:hypothetical protein
VALHPLSPSWNLEVLIFFAEGEPKLTPSIKNTYKKLNNRQVRNFRLLENIHLDLKNKEYSRSYDIPTCKNLALLQLKKRQS